MNNKMVFYIKDKDDNKLKINFNILGSVPLLQISDSIIEQSVIREDTVSKNLPDNKIVNEDDEEQKAILTYRNFRLNTSISLFNINENLIILNNPDNFTIKYLKPRTELELSGYIVGKDISSDISNRVIQKVTEAFLPKIKGDVDRFKRYILNIPGLVGTYDNTFQVDYTRDTTSESITYEHNFKTSILEVLKIKRTDLFEDEEIYMKKLIPNSLSTYILDKNSNIKPDYVYIPIPTN